MDLFVTAIGTDSGKTLVSAILCEAFHADYWKPVQAGKPYDTEQVRQWVSHPSCRFHPEAYRFDTAASPHAAAIIENNIIDRKKIRRPETDRPLVIEGAGGCLVPLNDEDFVIDLAVDLKASVILVSNLYLGSINHTLLSAEALRQRCIPVKGIIFNGDTNPESERIILKQSGFPLLLRIPRLPAIDQEIIQHYATELRTHWNGRLAQHR